MKNLKSKLLTGLICISSLSIAHADTTIANMEVSTNVTASCTISADSVIFPAFSQTTTSTMASVTSSYTTACSKNTDYSISLGNGLHLNGTSLRMSNGDSTPSYLIYTVYRGDGATVIEPGTVFSTSAGGGMDMPASWNLVTKLDKAQNVPAGSYSDTISLTLTY